MKPIDAIQPILDRMDREDELLAMNTTVRFFAPSLVPKLNALRTELSSDALDFYLVGLLLADDKGRIAKTGFAEMAQWMLEHGSITWQLWDDDDGDGEKVCVVEWEPHPKP